MRKLLLHVLQQRGWTDRNRQDVAATVLMVALGSDTIGPAYQARDEGRFRIDARLVSDLYASCPQALKIVLARTPAFKSLPPRVFKQLFLDACRQRALSALQRRELAYTLQAFLTVHPESAGDYEQVILAFARHRAEEVRLQGVRLLGFLNRLGGQDLKRLKELLAASNPAFQMNALNALCEMLKRPQRLAPELLAYGTSPETRALIQRLHREDPDEDVRLCAYYALKALRELSRRGGRGR